MCNNRYYIVERHTPQFKYPYYYAVGQLSTKEANKKRDPSYGRNIVHEYETVEEYNQAKQAFAKILSK